MKWVCPRCGVTQNPDEIATVEIIEPGSAPRVEFYGRIRPEGQNEQYIFFKCLVCGNIWDDSPDDPTPGGQSVTFLHPITEEREECCPDGCPMCDRDAC